MTLRGRKWIGAAIAAIGLGLLALQLHPAASLAADKKPAPAPKLSEEASKTLVDMGKSLLSPQESFKVQTIRIYTGTDGETLHIFHTLEVKVRRPDRMQASVTGDDAPVKLFYDGTNLALINVAANKYAVIPVPNTIQKMLETAMGKLHVDFPLADFLTDAPNKAFLTGVTNGKVVNTVTIDGTPCKHLYFEQPPGIELELWVEANERSLPRRLIVTYANLPGSPSFVAMFSDWNLSPNLTDADFQFAPPPGASKIDLPAAAAASR
jgi:hypothetical protein